MKTEPNLAVKELRRIIGRTQAELRLEVKLRPGWTPERSMNQPKPAEKIAVLGR